MSARLTDLDQAEVLLLNAELDAKRRHLRGTLAADELAAARSLVATALAAVRALRLVCPSPVRGAVAREDVFR